MNAKYEELKRVHEEEQHIRTRHELMILKTDIEELKDSDALEYVTVLYASPSRCLIHFHSGRIISFGGCIIVVLMLIRIALSKFGIF